MIPLLDVTSLLRRRGVGIMTGIDRVDFALARWLTGPGVSIFPNAAFLVNAGGVQGLLPRSEVLRLLDEALLRRGIMTPPGELFNQLADVLASPPPFRIGRGSLRLECAPQTSGIVLDRMALSFLALRGHRSFRRLLSSHATRLHLFHASHLGLQHRSHFRWISLAGARLTAFIHDMIPIDFPEFCSDGAHRSHIARVRTLASLGAGVVVNSFYTAERLEHYLAQSGLPMGPIAVKSLSADQLAMPPAAPVTWQTRSLHPYFVVAGTIEGRKNLRTVLLAWRRLLASAPTDRVPRLVIAGSRGWSNVDVLHDLDEMEDLSGHVVEVAGLNDAELALLTMRSEAVICASFAEGYSLVPAQAMVKGRPAVLSDIPAHRELDRQFPGTAIFFPPDSDADLCAIVTAGPRQQMPSPRLPSCSWEAFAASVFCATGSLGYI